MATYILLNRTAVTVNGSLHSLLPGALLDSTVDDTAAIAAAGGQLYPTGDTTIDAAALAARTAATRGQDPSEQALAVLASAAVSHDVQLDAFDARLDALEAAGGAGKFFATAATTGALAAYTRVGYVVTADANGALNPVDGQTLVAGVSKLWLKNPAAAADLALYDVTSIGGGGSKYVLTMNPEWIAAVGPGSQVFVNTGTVNKDKSWTVTNDTAITAGTTAVTIQVDVDAAALAASTGAASIGSTGPSDVQTDLNARPTAATLALATGAATIGTNVGGKNVEQRLVDTEAVANAGVGAVSRTVNITQAGDLAGLGGGVKTFTKNIGAVLPANAHVLGANIPVTAVVSGGGVATGTLSIGTAGDPIAIVNAADVKGAAVDGYAATMPAGRAPNKKFVAAGAQLIATLTTDTDLNALTGGDISAEVDIFVLA